MNSDSYRRDLERIQRQRADAERRVGDIRTKEADKRTASARARESALRTSSASSAGSRLRQADRLEGEANSLAREAARWQTKVAGYLKQEASLQSKITSAERSERQAGERRRAREEEANRRRAAFDRAALDSRLTAAEELAMDAYLARRPPKRERLRVLILGASADGDLRVGREQKRIRAAVESALHRDLIELDGRPAATIADLLDGLSRFRPHILHFSGHGDVDLIAFEEEIDAPHDGVIVTATAFAHAVTAADEPPLLVVLNACNSAAQIPQLVTMIPFAIGMSAEIDDSDAIGYAARFYTAIADGQSILSAHRLGQAALELAGLPGAELPTLGHAIDADPATTILVEPPD